MPRHALPSLLDPCHHIILPLIESPITAIARMPGRKSSSSKCSTTSTAITTTTTTR
ncbi:hypothetical protein PROFUN_15948, partial [Planoprotostelium fungivorum]